ncbi:class A beta-lactamase-related serine hydrolase [Hwanghaeella grinnelliae]|uniref:Class A beta-lactamase-related serine hydrolase n=1 Tax=Hwanghaeella grinnelliae TaxID=2500179 RepID=A0A3S2VPX0_9PROT|nr:serine hydrolase domain-containing protein [Hwanghaeella grinnelliae]RVU38876.1 class A beta-lactamase-related serine hydrolase [Hwanghaeella grinnelliae]
MGETIDDTSEAYLREMVAAEHFSGTVLVTSGDRVLHKRAYGPASESQPNQADQRLHVGSVTKQFTAAAILQLVEAGKITLDDPINSLLPDRYTAPIWTDITVRHLLSHTSGIPDYAVTRDYYDVTDGWAFDTTIDGMIGEAMTRALNFTPGSRFEYSNIGFTLLGKIIEAQTGRRYAAHIREELLTPLEMTDSEIHDEGFLPRPTDALGLRWEDASSRHVRDDVVSLPVTPADGGLVTTADDFLRWMGVYKRMTHPRLSRPFLEQMLQPVAPIDAKRWPGRDLRGEARYGLGVMRSGDLVMHEGSIVGFRSYFIYSLDDDLLIAVFSNNTTNNVFRIAAGLFDICQPKRGS